MSREIKHYTIFSHMALLMNVVSTACQHGHPSMRRKPLQE